MTAVDPRSCSASASTARLFAGMPPPFRLTLGPVLIFAMSPPRNYEALVPERKRGQQHGGPPGFVLASAGLIPFGRRLLWLFGYALRELCGRATRESKCRAEVELHARPMRAREMRRSDVLTFHARRPRAVDRLDHGRQVLDQCLLAERGLADDGVDHRGLID